MRAGDLRIPRRSAHVTPPSLPASPQVRRAYQIGANRNRILRVNHLRVLNPAADIIILGLPKLHHLGRVFVGSVAADVAACTTTPLLLVPQSSDQD